MNDFLNAGKEDVWLASLSGFHIGGLSIYIRAKESQSKVVSFRETWDANDFIQCLASNKVTFTSVVPTQLFDLVNLNMRAPDSLKGIFVGGDFLSNVLKKNALALGWPVIQTYGMTETCSQIASSYITNESNEFLQVLPIHHIELDSCESVINSSSLFSAEIIYNQSEFSVKFCTDDKFILKDRIELNNIAGQQYIKPLGRSDEYFKLKGRLFNFLDLKQIAHSVFDAKNVLNLAELVLCDAPREGKQLELWLQKDINHVDELVKCIEDRLPKVLKICNVKLFSKLPRNELGKLKRQ